MIYFAGLRLYFRRLARVRPERVKRQKQNKDLYRAFYAKPTLYRPRRITVLLRHVSIARQTVAVPGICLRTDHGRL